MTKPVMEFKDGQLHVSASHVVDAVADGKASASINVSVVLNPAEVISEIAKKDMALLEALLAQVKV